jgi:hypothetical protein
VLAFLAEAIDEIEDERLQDDIRTRLEQWLSRGGVAAEPMSVSRDIVATWRRPRRVMRAAGPGPAGGSRAHVPDAGLRDHLRVAMARDLAGGGA